MPADVTTAEGQVSLLINDINGVVFSPSEITALLDLEDGNVKRAAAQALDMIADDEALTSKAIRTQDLATDGAKVADSLRKRAASLRAQADKADDDATDGYFDVVDFDHGLGNAELTNIPRAWF